MKQWTVVLLVGILLMVIALPASDKEGITAGSSGSSASSELSSEDEAKSTELEEKLEEILSCSEGVGEAKVLIMTGQNGGLYSDGSTEVTGVLVAAQGADDPVTVQMIQEAVMSLFQMEAHNIKIMKMK